MWVVYALACWVAGYSLSSVEGFSFTFNKYHAIGYGSHRHYDGKYIWNVYHWKWFKLKLLKGLDLPC